MNLTAANLAAKSATNKLELDPEWEELYQARAEYGIADLSPKQLDDFLNRLVSDNALSQLYFKYVDRDIYGVHYLASHIPLADCCKLNNS